MRISKVTLIVRILVGGYLLYTAFTLLEALTTNTGKELFFYAAFSLLFVAAGLFFIIQSVRTLKDGRYIGGSKDKEEK